MLAVWKKRITAKHKHSTLQRCFFKSFRFFVHLAQSWQKCWGIILSRIKTQRSNRMSEIKQVENNSGWNIWNEFADNGMQCAGELMRNANYENPISWESSGEIVYSTGKTPLLDRSSDLKEFKCPYASYVYFVRNRDHFFSKGKSSERNLRLSFSVN